MLYNQDKYPFKNDVERKKKEKDWALSLNSVSMNVILNHM